MNKVKYFIGPMTQNVVDAILEYSNQSGNALGLIPSRRQVEFDGGYVNNWNTESFSKYVRSKSTNIILKRDHAGPGQGQVDDDGYESLAEDCKYLDLIHIDPWKKYPEFELGVNETIKMINYCYNLNPNIEYEVGTEEAIRRFEHWELEELISQLESRLAPSVFAKIKYLVIQSGTSLKGNTQTGAYDSERLLNMVAVAKKHNLISKEHNGDYIPVSIINEKFSLGLDSINIAPEFGLIETQTYLDHMEEGSEDFLKFWQICYESKKWVKWVDATFDPTERKKELIQICGHYTFSLPAFLAIKEKYSYLNNVIKDNLVSKLHQLYE